jgi:hypothetical protein
MLHYPRSSAPNPRHRGHYDADRNAAIPTERSRIPARIVDHVRPHRAAVPFPPVLRVTIVLHVLVSWHLLSTRLVIKQLVVVTPCHKSVISQAQGLLTSLKCAVPITRPTTEKLARGAACRRYSRQIKFRRHARSRPRSFAANGKPGSHRAKRYRPMKTSFLAASVAWPIACSWWRAVVGYLQGAALRARHS